jgi:hypothetical protein
MTDDFSLERLEELVVSRIVAHRQNHDSRRDIPAGVILTVCALIAGLSAGVQRAHRYPSSPGSESAVLAEDASLAPSSLLTTGQ